MLYGNMGQGSYMAGFGGGKPQKEKPYLLWLYALITAIIGSKVNIPDYALHVLWLCQMSQQLRDDDTLFEHTCISASNASLWTNILVMNQPSKGFEL